MLFDYLRMHLCRSKVVVERAGVSICWLSEYSPPQIPPFCGQQFTDRPYTIRRTPMSKRNFVFVFVLAALLTASCLFAAGIAAQKRLNSSSTKAAHLSLTNTTTAATTA